jgi:glycosyltransferase involved in cell wall biosynthesis
VRELVREIEAWNADVVHVEFAVASYALRLPVLFALLRALRPLEVRVVMTLHEVTRDTDSLRAPGRVLYRRLTELADRAIVHTQSAFDALVGAIGVRSTPVSLVPHPRAELPKAITGAEELRARYGLDDARVLLAFGFIHVDKGLDDLVCALRELGPDGGDVRLVVAGDVRRRPGIWRVFELRDQLHLRRVRRLISRFGLEQRVTFTGYVPSGEMRPWFELAAAAVLPYTRIEQSGVANLAAAAGAPVLASRVGGLVPAEGDPGRSFPPGDPARLAAVVRDFLSKPGTRQGGASKTAHAPPLEQVVTETLSLYDERAASATERSRDVEYA